MTITTTWTIDGIDCQTQVDEYTNVVYTIHWRVCATQAESSASVYGSSTLAFDPLNEFIPYENLTPEQVLSWTFAALGEDQKNNAEAAAISALENILQPKIVSNPLPWVNN